MLCKQGAPADRMYFVLKGRVRLYENSKKGGIHVKRFVGPGEWFGIIGISKLNYDINNFKF